MVSAATACMAIADNDGQRPGVVLDEVDCLNLERGDRRDGSSASAHRHSLHHWGSRR